MVIQSHIGPFIDNMAYPGLYCKQKLIYNENIWDGFGFALVTLSGLFDSNNLGKI